MSKVSDPQSCLPLQANYEPPNGPKVREPLSQQQDSKDPSKQQGKANPLQTTPASYQPLLLSQSGLDTMPAQPALPQGEV